MNWKRPCRRSGFRNDPTCVQNTPAPHAVARPEANRRIFPFRGRQQEHRRPGAGQVRPAATDFRYRIKNVPQAGKLPQSDNLEYIIEEIVRPLAGHHVLQEPPGYASVAEVGRSQASVHPCGLGLAIVDSGDNHCYRNSRSGENGFNNITSPAGQRSPAPEEKRNVGTQAGTNFHQPVQGLDLVPKVRSAPAGPPPRRCCPRPGPFLPECVSLCKVMSANGSRPQLAARAVAARQTRFSPSSISAPSHLTRRVEDGKISKSSARSMACITVLTS